MYDMTKKGHTWLRMLGYSNWGDYLKFPIPLLIPIFHTFPCHLYTYCTNKNTSPGRTCTCDLNIPFIHGTISTKTTSKYVSKLVLSPKVPCLFTLYHIHIRKHWWVSIDSFHCQKYWQSVGSFLVKKFETKHPKIDSNNSLTQQRKNLRCKIP